MMLALAVSPGSIVLSKSSGDDIAAIPNTQQEDGTAWLEEDGTQIEKEG